MKLTTLVLGLLKKVILSEGSPFCYPSVEDAELQTTERLLSACFPAKAPSSPTKNKIYTT